MSTQEQTPRAKILREMKLMLADGIVDIELDPEHYEFAIDKALGRYRQRSGNSIEESFIFLDTQPDVQVYTLPNEVQEVREIYRRTMGGTGGGTGAAIDPFSLAFTNNMYMIQNPGNMGSTGAGFLATYELAMGFRELAGRMFGRDVQYTWDVATHKLTLHRKFSYTENICLHVYNSRPETVLFNDVYAYPWLRDYSIAVCKQILGEARSKFSSIAGPQGGISMNGDTLKAEATAEMAALDEDLKNNMDSHEGYGFIIG